MVMDYWAWLLSVASSDSFGFGDGLTTAQDSINTVTPTPAKTPVDNMILQSAIPSSAELFTAYLGSYKDKNDPDKGQSFYTFGFIGKSPSTQPIRERCTIVFDIMCDSS
jgi:hypothetical protein